MIYLDNAATSFPKPAAVYEAMQGFLVNIGASHGRSTHRLAVQASRIVFQTREKIAELFNISDSSRIIFTSNATESINLALFGLLKNGDKVLATSMEHNAVMRPLRYLQKQRSIEISIVKCDPEGNLALPEFEKALKQGIKVVVINHGSNIIGTIFPLGELIMLIKKYGALVLVDAAQTAGACRIDVEKEKIDLLAFSGHKSLFGPQGTGGLYIREGLDVKPLKYGGTGSNSESDEQPDFLPDKYESGTLNSPGIAGLGAGVSYVLQQGIDNIFQHGVNLTRRLLDSFREIKKLRIYGPKRPEQTLPMVSINIEGLDSADVARVLNDEFDIYTRIGLHCAPLAHRTIGTFPKGTLRISFGYFNTDKDVDNVIKAFRKILKQK